MCTRENKERGEEKMQKKKYILLSSLLLGCMLTGCSNTQIPENVGKTELSENVKTTISPDSREAVIRSIGYDANKGETGSVFLVHISDELKEKADILEQITSSKYCKDWKMVYSMQADVQLQKNQLREEWMEWNDSQKDNITIEEHLEGFGFVNPFVDICSSPEQEETIITASQIKEDMIQGYTGKLAVTCEEGDVIQVKNIPDGLDMEEWDTIEAKDITIDKITMDTPWWINMESYSADPILILSWEKYQELKGEMDLCYYAFYDGGENQELRALVEDLVEKYGADNKMILWKSPYFEPLE